MGISTMCSRMEMPILALEKSSTFWQIKHIYLMLQKLSHFHVSAVQRSQIEFIGINKALDGIFKHLLGKHFHVEFFIIIIWGGGQHTRA